MKELKVSLAVMKETLSQYYKNTGFGDFFNRELEAKTKKETRQLYMSIMEQSWTFQDNDDGELSVIAYNGAKTHIEIPEGVMCIGKETFSERCDLTSVIIPKGVTSIGEEAFFGCSELTSLVIPEGVTSIGNGAFACCSGLKLVVIPESVRNIGDYAFAMCSGLKSLVIPDSVASIGKFVFDHDDDDVIPA